MIDDDDGSNGGKPAGAPTPDGDLANQKRIAARRRFLRIGAAGSAAIVVTVVHQRAFAGKKASVASNCVSMRGTPDLKNANVKKALRVSAQFGTVKNLICRPKPPVVDPNSVGVCIADKGPANYANASGVRPMYVSNKQLAKGCGNITDTVAASVNNRLYEQGFCPITYNSTTGILDYDSTAKYYTKNSNNLWIVPNNCKMPPPL